MIFGFISVVPVDVFCATDRSRIRQALAQRREKDVQACDETCRAQLESARRAADAAMRAADAEAESVRQVQQAQAQARFKATSNTALFLETATQQRAAFEAARDALMEEIAEAETKAQAADDEFEKQRVRLAQTTVASKSGREQMQAAYQRLRTVVDHVEVEKAKQGDLAEVLRERLADMLSSRRQRNQLAAQTDELNQQIQVFVQQFYAISPQVQIYFCVCCSDSRG